MVRYAYVDESGSREDLDPGTYVLTATIVVQSQLDSVRSTLSSLKPSGAAKLHWREERTDKRRLQLTTDIATLTLNHLVVVRLGTDQTRVERRRRLCLQRLLYELRELHVGEVIAESRGAADDRRDRTLLDTLRARHFVDAGIRLSHAPGPSDPALWIPDIVSGAVVQDRIGASQFLDPLRASITMITVDER